MAKKEVLTEADIDPVTGKVVHTPIGGGAKAGIVTSMFEDDAPIEGKKLCSGFVLLDEQKVFVNDLTREQYKHLKRTATEIQVEAEAIQKDKNRLVDRANEPLEDEDDREAVDAELTKVAEALKKRDEALEKKEAGLADWLIDTSVVGWELKDTQGNRRPFSEEALKQLRPTPRATLAQLLLQRSKTGRREADL
jgi:hypothetical protein